MSDSPSTTQTASPSPSTSSPATRALTPRQLDARRASAQKSTGPRTARGKRFSRVNATRHGHYARHYSDAFRETLLALKEDPAAFDRLRQRLLGELATTDDRHDAIRPTLALALEELAQLHWELDRERRRLNQMRERRRRALDQELVRRRAEIQTDEYGPPSYCERGMVNGPRSANTYKAIIDYLRELIEQVDHQDFTHYEHYVGRLYNIYGEMPRLHSAILRNFRRLSGRYEGLLPDPDSNTPRELRDLLVQEREKYKKEYEAFKPYWPMISEAERERARDLETLSEESDDDLERLEWEASLKRQEHLRRALDRKLRTVIALQREARLQEAHAARMAEREERRQEAEGGRQGSEARRQRTTARDRAGAERQALRGSRAPRHSAPSPPSPLPPGGGRSEEPATGGGDARAPKNEGTNRRSGLESTGAEVSRQGVSRQEREL